MDTQKCATVRVECPVSKRRKRRTFSKEFQAKAVRVFRSGTRSIAQVAADLDLTENSLRRWIKQAEVDAGKGAPEALTSAEKEELTRLRRENKQLKQDREILKAAATFFAKEKQ